MRNILFRIWSFFTGAGVPKPGDLPAGYRWSWEILNQMWTLQRE